MGDDGGSDLINWQQSMALGSTTAGLSVDLSKYVLCVPGTGTRSRFHGYLTGDVIAKR